jgi:hypothetical protein
MSGKVPVITTRSKHDSSPRTFPPYRSTKLVIAGASKSTTRFDSSTLRLNRQH